jgi:hypothetical protein
MRIRCSIEETTLENDNGRDIAGVTATCSRCGHSTESFGTDEPSVLRCLALLNDECPEGEDNFYIADDE